MVDHKSKTATSLHSENAAHSSLISDLLHKDSVEAAPCSKTHVKHLDGLRAITAIYVVLHHAVMQMVKPSGTIYTICSKLLAKGHFAVDAFIVISGFCLMMPLVKNNSLTVEPMVFIKKRIRRILPTYYLAMAFSLLLIYTLIGTPSGTNWDESIPVTKWDIFTHCTLIQDIFYSTNTKINHAFWSISVEFRIYFFFPLLVLLFRKTNPIAVTIGATVLSVAAWLTLQNWGLINTGLNGTNLHYIGLFTMGMLAAYIAYSNKKALVQIKESGGLLQLLCVVGGAGFILDSPKISWWVAADILIGAATACLLIALNADKRESLRKFFSWKPLAFVGTFAYSIYLIHAPLLEVFSRYFIAPLGLSPATAMFSFVLLATPLILLLSYGFFLVAEKPFMKMKVSNSKN